MECPHHAIDITIRLSIIPTLDECSVVQNSSFDFSVLYKYLLKQLSEGKQERLR